jgi:hypothetical protein
MGVARYGKGGLSTDRAALDEAVSAGVKSIEQYVRDIVRPTGITC